ncbi:MAG: hypothetical protein NVS2B14_21810 [Chamaesiphon sp.]
MAYYDFMCGSCGHQFEDKADFETRKVECPHCQTITAERLPVLIGGYQGNLGGSSTRPKNSAAMKKAKVFTGSKPE